MNKRYKKIFVLLVPILILFCFAIPPLVTYIFGEEIVLETKPVDPRDLFRGDYVILNYEIEEVDIRKWKDREEEENHIYRGRKVYVILKENNDIYEVDYITEKKPKNKLYINGKVNYIWTTENEKEEKIMLSYGLDSYFVPENTGGDLEELSRKGKLIAKVKLFKGFSVLKEVTATK